MSCMNLGAARSPGLPRSPSVIGEVCATHCHFAVSADRVSDVGFSCRQCRHLTCKKKEGSQTNKSLENIGELAAIKSAIVWCKCQSAAVWHFYIHSSNEPSDLSPCLCHYDNTVNVVPVLIIVITWNRFLQRKRFRLFLHISPWRSLSVCRLLQSCTLLKPSDWFRCYITGLLVEFSNALC